VHLQPALKALNRANGAVQPFAKEAAPIVQSQIRPFVRDARPVVRSTTKPANELAAATPDLTSSFTVLNHLFNLAGYNPNGREGPSKDGREEGYLFWIAWLQHNGAALFSTSDANGPFRPVTLGGTCSVLKSITSENPPLNQTLLPALTDPKICGTN
jgi:phospholipid/cholesterol/gamma-HCH transport system substrate-binding protein